MTGLPPADPLLVADTVAALPARLRAKLDGVVAQASSWEVSGGSVRLANGVVTLTPADGVLREPGQVTCACLLAPACLHRAGVLAACPVADPASPSTSGVPAVSASDDAWQAGEQRAAAAVAAAAGRLLGAGLPGAGAAVQAELLRALHQARLEGLHRLAAGATRLVTAIRAGRDDDPAFRLGDLTGDLVEVLQTAHLITTGRGDPAVWRGRARTGYAAVGGLRLTGLCLEPVVSDAGYAGVVVWLVDPSGRRWTVSDVRPGGADRLRASAEGPVAIGETGLTHRQLARSGMILTGATANADGRLGAGKGVRATKAPGTPWADPPLRALFEAGAGVTAGPERAGSWVLLDVTVAGSAGQEILAVDGDGGTVRLTVPPTPGTTFRENLRLLAASPGLRMLVAGRRPPDRPHTVELLAVGGGDLHLPAEFGGHADLGLDHLSPSFLQPSAPPPAFSERPEPPDPLDAFTRRHERVVAGGRLTLTAPGTRAAVRTDVAALRRNHLPTGADLLESLVAAARPDRRDPFGRLITPDDDTLARQWLAAGVYLRAARERPAP